MLKDRFSALEISRKPPLVLDDCGVHRTIGVPDGVHVVQEQELKVLGRRPRSLVYWPSHEAGHLRQINRNVCISCISICDLCVVMDRQGMYMCTSSHVEVRGAIHGGGWGA